MQITKVHIKGFRNFDDAWVYAGNPSLLIGPNDSGKTNFLTALRLLFDRSYSDMDLDLLDSDYNIYSKAQTVEITVYMEKVTEDCLRSVFDGKIKDGNLILQYRKNKESEYELSAGFSDETMVPLQSRTYLRRLNMQYVNTNRDLFSFLRHERKRLLEISRSKLTQEQAKNDEKLRNQIQQGLDAINSEINDLTSISMALESVNDQLQQLSIGNEDQRVRFIAGNSDAERLLQNISLAAISGQDYLTIGGDGRNNQIFIATWIAEQKILNEKDHVTFYAVEEPEAHLHPHQQRKLAEYLSSFTNSQVFLTTHSPHIAENFATKQIIRLYQRNKITQASSQQPGSKSNPYIALGYRLNVMSAEVLFSSGVFLVEGVSEVMLFRALAQELSLDLDRFNISILAVEGVGFKPYIHLLDELSIPWVLRTDNDVFSKNNKSYYAGISRALGILEESGEALDGDSYIEPWSSTRIPDAAKQKNEMVCKKLQDKNIYLSNEDLENDLARSPIGKDLKEYYKVRRVNQVVKKMQQRKAENMFQFLSERQKCLKKLNQSDIVAPLRKLREMVQERMHPQNDNKAHF